LVGESRPLCVTAPIPVAKITSDCPLVGPARLKFLCVIVLSGVIPFKKMPGAIAENRHSLPVTIRTPTERLMSARMVPIVPERSVFSHGSLVLRGPNGHTPENNPDTGAIS